jgi:acyl-CoA reductase-like NAD-dependent aldehyde dehydrogenase
VFTSDINRVMTAFAESRVGGVVINDIPGFRADHMPYGGVKGSGTGKEGPRYAIRELTEERLLVILWAKGPEAMQ